MNTEDKVKGTIKFYTPGEEQILINELKRGKSVKELTELYSIIWNRTLSGMYGKLYNLNKTIKKELYIPKKEKIVKIKSAKITMPEGMVFEGDSKKVEIYSDHFRIYF